MYPLVSSHAPVPTPSEHTVSRIMREMYKVLVADIPFRDRAKLRLSAHPPDCAQYTVVISPININIRIARVLFAYTISRFTQRTSDNTVVFCISRSSIDPASYRRTPGISCANFSRDFSARLYRIRHPSISRYVHLLFTIIIL